MDFEDFVNIFDNPTIKTKEGRQNKFINWGVKS